MKYSRFLIFTVLFLLHHAVGAQNSTPKAKNGQAVFDPKLQISADDILARPARKAQDAQIKAFVDSFLKIGKEQTGNPNARKKYSIKGIVRDVNTNEGIPFAQIRFPKSTIGSSTELDGTFTFDYNYAPSDTLLISAVGYKGSFRLIDQNVQDINLEIDLARSENLLREVIIKPGEDPAIALVKKIIAAKPNNNPDKYDNYKYELYNKLELDLVRMSRAQFSKIPLMKPFAFVFDNVDSFSEKKPFLPVFLTETLSDYYFQRSPKKTKEFIKASQIKGIENESVTQFLGGMYQQINLYSNFIDVFDKQFVSPINNSATNYYRYQIKDTQYAYGHRIILVQFAPKRAAENCFIGDFWVVDSIFALQRISL
jgi:hypothetical protein